MYNFDTQKKRLIIHRLFKRALDYREYGYEGACQMCLRQANNLARTGTYFGR